MYVEKIRSEIFGKMSDFIFLYAEKIKSEIFIPFGHRNLALNRNIRSIDHETLAALMIACK